jgi:hypothetical protein
MPLTNTHKLVPLAGIISFANFFDNFHACKFKKLVGFQLVAITSDNYGNMVRSIVYMKHSSKGHWILKPNPD